MEKALQDVTKNRQKKNMLLHSMLEITVLQKTQLSQDEVEALLGTTEKWNALAMEIDALEKEYRIQMQELSQSNAAQLLGKATEIIEQLDKDAQSLLLRIQKEHAECNAIAEERMQTYKGELKDAKKSNQRTSSYVNAYTVSEDGIYFDKKK